MSHFKIMERIKRLNLSLMEEREDPIRPGSIDSLLSFLEVLPEKYQAPSLSVPPSGNIRAHWDSILPEVYGVKRYFAIEFSPNGEHWFVYFGPHNHPEAAAYDRFDGPPKPLPNPMEKPETFRDSKVLKTQQEMLDYCIFSDIFEGLWEKMKKRGMINEPC